MVQFGTLKFRRTILVSRTVWSERSHYCSRVSFREAPTNNKCHVSDPRTEYSEVSVSMLCHWSVGAFLCHRCTEDLFEWLQLPRVASAEC